MKNLIVLIVLLSCLLNVGCFKERIDLELNSSNQKLVVDAWITDFDEQQFVELSLTSDYFDDFEPTYVDDANVTLSHNMEVIELTSVGNGRYNLPQNWQAVLGEKYELVIQYDDETYLSSTTMRPMPEIENLRQEQLDNDSLELYEVYFDFWENNGEGDGYYGIDYQKGTIQGDTILNGGFTNDDFVDGLYFEHVTVTNDAYEKGDTVVLELYSIGKDAADYLQAIDAEVYRDGLFDPAPANIDSNFSNGAFGFFIIGGAQKTELIIR